MLPTHPQPPLGKCRGASWLSGIVRPTQRLSTKWLLDNNNYNINNIISLPIVFQPRFPNVSQALMISSPNPLMRYVRLINDHPCLT